MLRTLGDRQPSWFIRNEVRMKMFNLSFIKALFNMIEKKFKVENWNTEYYIYNQRRPLVYRNIFSIIGNIVRIALK